MLFPFVSPSRSHIGDGGAYRELCIFHYFFPAAPPASGSFVSTQPQPRTPQPELPYVVGALAELH
jgi:hypothetical protein